MFTNAMSVSSITVFISFDSDSLFLQLPKPNLDMCVVTMLRTPNFKSITNNLSIVTLVKMDIECQQNYKTKAEEVAM